MHVLIGGMGDIGSGLAVRLAAKGARVWGIRRRPLAGGPPGVSLIQADLCAPDLAEKLPPHCDIAVYMAAPGPPRNEETYRRIYVEGLRSFIRALESLSHPPARLFFASSTSVYGDHGGGWVDESTCPQPTGFSGKVLLEAEACLGETEMRSTAVRIGGIYGPGRTRLLDRVAGGGAVRERDERYTNRIHRDDCIAVFEHLIDLDDPQELYLAVDHAPARYNDVLSYLAELTGATLGRAQDNIVPSSASLRGPSNKRVSNARLLASGYTFRFPSFREGYGALVEETQRDR